MPQRILTQHGHITAGLVPVADAFSGTVRTDVYSMKNQHAVEFLIFKGAGALGRSTITVNACDDVVPTNRTAIPFRYRAMTTFDTWGALTDATTAGFTTTAGANQLYEIIVDAQQLGDTGYSYVELTAVESVDDPVTGCILTIFPQPRQEQATPATVLA